MHSDWSCQKLFTFFSRTKYIMASEGADVPNVIFKGRVRDESIGGPNPFKWKDVSSEDLFKGKRVVVFALPGGTKNNTSFNYFSSP